MTPVSATVFASDPSCLAARTTASHWPLAPGFLLGGIMLHFTHSISCAKCLPAGAAPAATAADSKLLLLIRHGQAVSNALQEKLGPDAWTDTESKCNYTDREGNVSNLFDAGGCAT